MTLYVMYRVYEVGGVRAKRILLKDKKEREEGQDERCNIQISS